MLIVTTSVLSDFCQNGMDGVLRIKQLVEADFSQKCDAV